MPFCGNRWFDHFCVCTMSFFSVDVVIISVVFVKFLLSVSFHHYHISGCIGTQLSDCDKVALPIIFMIS